MQKITPNLWFDGNAREAAEFYINIFPSSAITGGTSYPNSEEEGLADFQRDLAGKDLTVDFTLADLNFVGINAGPEFKPTPANSFMVNFDPSRMSDAKQQLDQLWSALSDGGEVLMPLDKYDFSEHYGWVKDKYGFSWQLILTDPDGDERPMIIPSLMFGGRVQNRSNEAIDYYVSVFKDSQKGMSYPYEQQIGPATPEALMFAEFTIGGQWFTANDSAVEQDFTFNEAVSYSVICKNQDEIDYLWDRLSNDPQSEQCGWCKDKFGVSWQIVPENMEELMKKPNAFKTMMNQHKIIIADY